MFDYFRHLLETEDGKVLFLLALIACAMVIDVCVAAIAARVNPERQFQYSGGMNSVLRKLASFTLLAFLIPVSVLLPKETGAAALYVLYLRYLLVEIQSILEKLKDMGNRTDLLERFIQSFRKNE